jgi:hypothetical protein
MLTSRRLNSATAFTVLGDFSITIPAFHWFRLSARIMRAYLYLLIWPTTDPASRPVGLQGVLVFCIFASFRAQAPVAFGLLAPCAPLLAEPRRFLLMW